MKMSKVYKLASDVIDNVVPEKVCGNYRIGKMVTKNGENKFSVQYVGRSDNDLRERIKDHIPEKYTLFRFSTCQTSEEAFYQECEDWHRYGAKLDNYIHPDRPDGTNYKCPYCDELDED